MASICLSIAFDYRFVVGHWSFLVVSVLMWKAPGVVFLSQDPDDSNTGLVQSWGGPPSQTAACAAQDVSWGHWRGDPGSVLWEAGGAGGAALCPPQLRPSRCACRATGRGLHPAPLLLPLCGAHRGSSSGLCRALCCKRGPVGSQRQPSSFGSDKRDAIETIHIPAA